MLERGARSKYHRRRFEANNAMKEIVRSVVLIVIAGGLAGVAAWWLARAMGLDGTPGALVAAVIGMVLAVALFAGLTVLLRRIGWIR